MNPGINRWLILAIMVILASGMALALWTIQREDNLMRTDLLSTTHHIGREVRTDYVSDLNGSSSDLGSPNYIILKNQLMQLRSYDTGIRSIQILGWREDGTVFLYVDSAPFGSEYYQTPGQVYPESSATLLQVFSQGQEATEGPLTDRTGSWVRGLVPVTDAAGEKVVAVLVTGIDARDWYMQIIKASAPAFIAMLLLVLLVLILFYILQRNEKENQLRAESAAILRESENRYRTVFEGTGTAMLIIEEDTTIGFANREFFRLTGYSQEDIDKGRSWTEFIFKEDLPMMIEQHRLRRHQPEEAIRQYEFRLITHSGEIRNILLTIDMLPGTKRSVGSLIDITENKVAQKALERYAQEITRYAETIRHINDKLNLLNSITRHDILNQLTVILNYLDLMKMKFPDPELQEYIEKEIHAAQNIRTQIMFTRDYQDIGAQAPRWFNLKNVIVSGAAHLPLSPVLPVVEFDMLEIYADPLFEKVIYTLLENTLRHGKNVTSIVFSAHTLAQGLVILYQDNGGGIPAEHKEAIFERRFFTHTGFGLFLSRTILGITGMNIRETGEPGTGARFEITVSAGGYRFSPDETPESS